jgi:hypothetical protein
MTDRKIQWQGKLTSVQPRITLLRSFDQRNHNYLGYVLSVDGTIGDEERQFCVAIGKAAHAKHEFRIGDVVSGECTPVADPRRETAEFYKVSGLKLIERSDGESGDGPPWQSVPPPLEVYRERGHRRLDARTYDRRCTTCIWGCRMPVEMIIDQWNPSVRRYRTETFCYGPKSCPFYRAGPTRKVPGRKGMTWEEEDWVDEDATSHRGPDD